MTFALTWHDFG